jgi:hypothetical protein
VGTDADVGYKKNADADGFRFGDEFFTDLSFQYRVWPRQLGADVPAFLFAVVEANLEAPGEAARRHAGRCRAGEESSDHHGRT